LVTASEYRDYVDKNVPVAAGVFSFPDAAPQFVLIPDLAVHPNFAFPLPVPTSDSHPVYVSLPVSVGLPDHPITPREFIHQGDR
jgi:hypothetical protein